MKKLIISLSILVIISAAFAIPTFNGSTGGLLVENADVTKKIVINSYFFQNKTLIVPNIEVTIPMSAIIKDSATLENVEISGAYQNSRKANNYSSIGVKYVLPTEFYDIKLAAGGNYITHGDKNVYLAGTYNIEDFDLKASAKVFYGFNSKNPYISGSIEKGFDNFTAGIEYLNDQGCFDLYATSDELVQNIGVTAGILNIGSSRKAQFVAGVNYTF